MKMAATFFFPIKEEKPLNELSVSLIKINVNIQVKIISKKVHSENNFSNVDCELVDDLLVTF